MRSAWAGAPAQFPHVLTPGGCLQICIQQMEVGGQLAASIVTDLQLEHRLCLCFRLIPRCMINVSQIDLTFNLLGEALLPVANQQLQESSQTACSLQSAHPCHAGQRLAMPVLIAPMSQMRMASKEGELGMARAAAAANTCMVCD